MPRRSTSCYGRPVGQPANTYKCLAHMTVWLTAAKGPTRTQLNYSNHVCIGPCLVIKETWHLSGTPIQLDHFLITQPRDDLGQTFVATERKWPRGQMDVNCT